MKKIYTIPIMQVIYSTVDITAYSEDEALDLLNEMDEAEMGYPFDFQSPQIEVDTSSKIGFIEVGGMEKAFNHLVVLEGDANA